MKTLLPFLLFLTGCAALHHQTEDDPAVEQARLARVAEARAAYGHGPAVDTPATKPASKYSEIEKCETKVEPCDLVVYNSQTEANDFFKNCKKDKASQKECETKIGDMLVARMSIKYPYADAKLATLQCKAEPVKCDTSTFSGLVQLEMYLRNTHDAKLAEMDHQRGQEIRQRELADQAAERQRISQAFQAFGAGISRDARRRQDIQELKQQTCTSTRVGNQVQTTCH